MKDRDMGHGDELDGYKGWENGYGYDIFNGCERLEGGELGRREALV